MKSILSLALLILGATTSACGGPAENNSVESSASDLNTVSLDAEAMDGNASANDAAAAEATSAALNNIQDTADRVTEAKPEPASAGSSAPSYDIASYCRKVGDAAGGSSIIEKSCRDMENDALAAIEARTVPARVHTYCDRVGEAAGGSYQIYNSCVDMELDAASQL
ncbi:MAG TPA: hypothetical protein VGC35_13320 [Allosphingosinicella sp.]|jgi:hypothetical protein